MLVHFNQYANFQSCHEFQGLSRDEMPKDSLFNHERFV